MKDPLPQISDAELQVMEVIWKDSPISTNAICSQVAATHSWNEKTIQTLIKRLHTKGAIDYEKKGRMFYYIPLVSREDYVRKETKSFLERFYQGHIGEMVSGLLSQEVLTSADLEELSALLEKKRKEDAHEK